MPLRYSALLLLCLINVMLMAACAEEDLTPAFTEANYTEEASNVYCARAFECCSEAERGTLLAGLTATTEEECRTTYAGLIQGTLETPLKASVEAGRVAFDGAAAQTCLEAAQGLSCGAFFGDANAIQCAGIITPLVENGSACTRDFDCKSDFCNTPSGTTEGVCEDLPGDGAACALFCAEGFYCEASVCVAAIVDGQSCTASSQCLSGFCNDDENGRFCTAPPQVCASQN